MDANYSNCGATTPTPRRKVGLGRTLATRRSTTDVTTFLDRVSHQLELTPAITLNALNNHACQTGYGPHDLTD